MCVCVYVQGHKEMLHKNESNTYKRHANTYREEIERLRHREQEKKRETTEK